ncbi:MAG: hypothetical protein J0I84_08910 [Terrimonas sp.]|nr:hypothetical protein [Terrimonas sp.]OJY80735.1 MAG: hypothetical protein BGP13_00070 [Sphingobacteriales bacterium 40-81]
MTNIRKGKKDTWDKDGLMLTEEDINTQEYCRHLSPEQKSGLIAFVHEISQVLYNSYFESNEHI